MGHFFPKFQVEGASPINHLCTVRYGQWMPYSSAAESFHTKKLHVADFLRVKPNFHTENEKNRFWGPLWGLLATYAVYLRLIEKLVGLVDFLLVILNFPSLGAFVLSQCTAFARVWRTDGRTDGRPARGYTPRCIRCSAVIPVGVEHSWRQFRLRHTQMLRVREQWARKMRCIGPAGWSIWH